RRHAADVVHDDGGEARVAPGAGAAAADLSQARVEQRELVRAPEVEERRYDRALRDEPRQAGERRRLRQAPERVVGEHVAQAAGELAAGRAAPVRERLDEVDRERPEA